jgi:hypothetical protein
LPNRREIPLWRRSLLLLAEAVIILYVVLDSFVLPLFRPLLRFLARLRLVRRIEAFIASLPAYVILVLLAVPFFIADPAKIYGLFLIGTGHFLTGLGIFIGAYLISFVLVERVFQAGEAKLRGIGWFAMILDWLFRLRDKVIHWAEATAIWQFTLRIRQRAQTLIFRLLEKQFRRAP